MKSRINALVSRSSFVVLLLAAGCMSPAPSNNGTSGGGGKGGSSSGGSTGSGGIRVTTGSGGTTTTTTGAGGITTTTGAGGGGGTTTTTIRKVCGVKTTMMEPMLIDFESYNGTVTASAFGTAFGGATANSGTAYIGPFAYPEVTGSPMPDLSMVAGHPPSSMWAVAASLMATNWGMGGGFWVGSPDGPSCINASAYKGISLWVRGTGSALAVFSVSLNMDSTTPPDPTNAALGGTCTTTPCTPATMQNIPLTADWTQQTILWSQFTPGMSGTTAVVPNGDNISGIAWSVPLQFVLGPGATDPMVGPYVPVPASLLINIDDVQFVP